MSTFIKFGIIAATCFGTYMFFGSHVHKANEFAFGLDGFGFTYLALGTFAVGCVTYKFVK